MYILIFICLFVCMSIYLYTCTCASAGVVARKIRQTPGQIDETDWDSLDENRLG